MNESRKVNRADAFKQLTYVSQMLAEEVWYAESLEETIKRLDNNIKILTDAKEKLYKEKEEWKEKYYDAMTPYDPHEEIRDEILSLINTSEKTTKLLDGIENDCIIVSNDNWNHTYELIIRER